MKGGIIINLETTIQKIDKKYCNPETKTTLKLLARSENILDNVFIHIMNNKEFEDKDIIEMEKLACDISSYLHKKLFG